MPQHLSRRQDQLGSARAHKSVLMNAPSIDHSPCMSKIVFTLSPCCPWTATPAALGHPRGLSISAVSAKKMHQRLFSSCGHAANECLFATHHHPLFPMTTSPRPFSQCQSASGCQNWEKLPSTSHMPLQAVHQNPVRSSRSQACADEAMQCDKAHELPIILHWEESYLPWRPLHLLHSSSPG